jgi:lycopene cyclase domain-containing protein
MYEHFTYVVCLLLTLLALGTIDYHYQLAFFGHCRTTLLTLSSAVILFLLWDIAGVQLNIFYAGLTRFTLHIFIWPNIPIEEIFFLTVLCYLPLLSMRFWERRHE